MVEFDANGITSEHYVGVDGNNNPITADSSFIWGSCLNHSPAHLP